MSVPVRWLFWLGCVVAAASGCTKPNPNACCTNEAECLALGADELRPCGGGEVCSGNLCVPVQCETAEQCSGATPYCIDQLCVGSCQVEADCQGIPGAPICAADKVCVGCRDHADCSGTTPICDAEDRKCRGCEVDGDCASGICLEADGVCAAESEVVYVVPGRSDTGECSKLAPCGTLEYAMTKTLPPRTTIRIDGGQQLQISNTLLLSGRVLSIDSSGSSLAFTGAEGVPMIAVGNSGRVTIEGVKFTPRARDLVEVRAAGTLRLHRVTTTTEQGVAFGAFFRVLGGNLFIGKSNMGQRTSCSASGALTIEESLVTSLVDTVGCLLTVRRSKFVDGQLEVDGGVALIENNLVTSSNELSDLMIIKSVGQGSRFAFNTVVNTSGVVSEGVALLCDATARVENNIFAYRSTTPHTGGCPTRYSLYDDAFLDPPGEGNLAVPFAAIFIDSSAADFRPSATSVAREMSEPGAISREDHNRRPRPQPVGTRPDVGAFEVP